MNRSETKLLVENWRNLLHRGEYTCGADFLESCNFDGKFLNESSIQKANTNKSKLLNVLAALMLSSSFGGALNKVQAKGLGGRANDAFSEMDDSFKQQDLNEAEKEEKLLMTMLDLLEEEAGMPSSLRKRFEDKYKNGGPETKAAIIIMCMKKVKSLAPEVARRGKSDPLVKKYNAVDVAKETAKGEKDGKGKDKNGEFIIRNGKKFYLTSTKINVTHFKNQKEIDRMKSAEKGRR